MQRKQGMTLVEIMVGVFLSSLVLGAGFQIFNSSQRKLTHASTRQILANEVRVAIKTLAQDFKAVKADSLEVNAANTGNTALISFDRYMVTGEGDQEKLAFDRFEKVTYEFRKPFLTRNTAGVSRTIARNLDSLSFARPEGPGEPPAGATANYDEGWAARMDITMTGSKKIPGTSDLATHSESVSVFMIEEYHKLVNKNRYLSMSTMSKEEETKIADESFDLDSFFQSVLNPEELAKLSREQLEQLKGKEADALKVSQDNLDQLNEYIDGVDTSGKRVLGFLWRGDTEVTAIQNDLKRHSRVDQIKGDLAKLDDTIAIYERDNMKDAFKGANVPIDTMDKESQQYKDLKEAYDLKLRDYSMKKAYESGKQEGDPPYTSMLDSYNPSNCVQGSVRDTEGNQVEFEETTEEFQARREKATKIYDNAQKVDLTWMDDKSGELRVKLYGAAKDLRDLAEAKLSYAEQRDANLSNIEKITTAIRGAS